MMNNVESGERVVVMYNGHMTVTATEFKAKCLALIDRVHAGGEPVSITKRGRVVARLVGDIGGDQKPWLVLREQAARWNGDPFAPAIDADEVEALK